MKDSPLWIVIPKPVEANDYQDLKDWGLDISDKALFVLESSNKWEILKWDDELSNLPSNCRLTVLNSERIEIDHFPNGFFKSFRIIGSFLHYDDLSGLQEYTLDRLAEKWKLKRDKMVLHISNSDDVIPVPLSSIELPWSQDIITFRQSLAGHSPDFAVLQRAYQDGQNHIFKETLFRKALQVLFPLYIDLTNLMSEAGFAGAETRHDIQQAIEMGRSAYEAMPIKEKTYLDRVMAPEGQSNDIESRFVKLREALENLSQDDSKTQHSFINAFKGLAPLFQQFTIQPQSKRDRREVASHDNGSASWEEGRNCGFDPRP